MEQRWYAVYTKPRWEKKTAEQLKERNIENYCPLNKVIRQWHDRKKIIYEPLFTSYVFVRCNEKQLSEVRQVDGAINFVYWLGKPAIIKDEEIDIIKRFLNEHTNVTLEKANVEVNDTVRILNGPLMDHEGTVLDVSNKTVKVSIPSLGYMMVAATEKQNIKVVNRLNN